MVILPALQLSLAVGGVQVAVWLQVRRPGPVLTVILAGQFISTGAWLSTTLTLKLQTAILFDASLTVHVTDVVPSGKTKPASVVPELMLLLMAAPGQLSLYASGSNSFPTAVYVQTPLFALLD